MKAGVATPLARRGLLTWVVGGSALAALGCAGAAANPAATRGPTAALGAADWQRLADGGGALPIVQRKEGERGVLRLRARPLQAADLPHVARLERRMRETLLATGSGVGLAAPQVGFSARVVLVKLGARGQAPRIELFVNPRIVERTDEIELDYEGCLSIPGVCGLVRRNRGIVVEHGESSRAPRRLEVEHFDARIFQHEIDHLDGVLYIDRVEGVLQPMERLKELREELRRQELHAARLPPRQAGAILL